MNGAGQPDPLHELWLRARRVLAPFGVQVGTEVLALWRDQAAHSQGPIRAAENGDAQAVEDLIALLRLLTGTEEPQAAKSDVHPGEG